VELEARLIDDLLDSTRIVSGKLKLHRKVVDATELIVRAVAIVEGDAKAKNVRLDVKILDKPCWIDADPARFQQVIWNMAKNAVKFTSPGGWVRLFCERETALVRVTVQDNGIGIEADHLEKIFNAFEQGDEQISHRFGGLGLGLAISKALVELHGGSLVAKSDGRGKGATFIVEFPFATESVEEPISDPELPASRQSLRLLIVEDHEATAQVMSRLLAKRGYAVSVAGTVEDALNAMNTMSLDILISDVGLPDGSGRDLMKKIRKTHNLPGIALSGYGTEADVAQSSEAGFSLHLTKPVDIDVLDEAIQKLAGNREKNSH